MKREACCIGRFSSVLNLFSEVFPGDDPANSNATRGYSGLVFGSLNVPNLVSSDITQVQLNQIVQPTNDCSCADPNPDQRFGDFPKQAEITCKIFK